MKFLSFLLFIHLSIFSASAADTQDLNQIDLTQKIKLIMGLREFARAMEIDQSIQTNDKYVFIHSLFSVYAAPGDSCVVAGWVSTRQSNNTCSLPENSLYQQNSSSCSAGQIPCNPVLFGANLCIPFDRPEVRNYAFSNCDKKFDQEGRSLSKIVEQIPEEEFKKYIDSVKDVCLNPSSVQSKKPMCKSILSKFNQYIPGDHSGNMARSIKSIDKGDINGIEKSALKLHDELKEAEIAFENARCATLHPDNEFDQKSVPECEQLSRRILKIHDLLKKSASRLEELAAEDCASSTNGVLSSNIENSLAVAAKVDCTSEEKLNNEKNCKKDLGCLLGSEIFGSMIMLVQMSPLKNNCISPQNSCMANIIGTAVRTLWSTITSLWDLLKAGWNYVKDKSSKLWTSLWGIEDKTSDVQSTISHLSESDKKQIATSPIEWMKNFLSNIWDATQDYISNDVYCEKWSTNIPGTGQCLQPFRGFSCMNCAKRITTNCAAFGVVVGEVLPAFLTGGIAGAASASGKGAAVISKAIKASKLSAKISGKLAKLPTPVIRGGQVALNSAISVGKAVAHPAKVAFKKTNDLLSAVKKSEKTQKILSSANSFLNGPMMSPVTGVVKKVGNAVVEVETAAFKAGYAAGGGIVDPITKAGVGAIKTADKALGYLDELEKKKTIQLMQEKKILEIAKNRKQVDDLFIYEIDPRMNRLNQLNEKIESAKKANNTEELKNLINERNITAGNSFKKLQDEFKKNGITTNIIDKSDEFGTYPVLQIDLSSSTPGSFHSPVLKAFKSMGEKYDVKSFTFDPIYNIRRGSGGFFSGREKRVEIGERGIKAFIEGNFDLNVISHEGRHAFFYNLHQKGISTPYNGSFYSKDGLGPSIYNHHMSLEELYNSTIDLRNVSTLKKNQKKFSFGNDSISYHVDQKLNLLEEQVRYTNSSFEKYLSELKSGKGRVNLYSEHTVIQLESGDTFTIKTKSIKSDNDNFLDYLKKKNPSLYQKQITGQFDNKDDLSVLYDTRLDYDKAIQGEMKNKMLNEMQKLSEFNQKKLKRIEKIKELRNKLNNNNDEALYNEFMREVSELSKDVVLFNKSNTNPMD